MQKKIQTLTFHHVLNYGAVLQAYALVKYLNDVGYDARVTNYLPKYFLLQTYRPCKSLSRTVNKIKKIKHFHDFRSKHLPLTKKSYFSFEQLNKNHDADVYICGSDQVWNKKLTQGSIDPAFLLDFVSEKSKRVSFAASAGSSRVLDDSKKLAKYFSNFDALGVREGILADDLNKVVKDKDVEVVLDPSLLINDYSEVSRFDRVPQDDFILTYVVGSNDTLSFFDESVAELKKHTNMKIIHVGAKEISSADENILDLGPQDWVAFLSRAKFIATNSFHGTAFAINFKKQFAFIPNLDENLNQRQMTLLKNLDIENRRLKGIKQMPSLYGEVIDYSDVSDKLNSLILRSKEFLDKALS